MVSELGTARTVESMSDDGDLVASGYDLFYSSWGRSPTLRRIWRDHVTGPDYPEDFAHISFLPFAQLRALAEGLNLAADQLLVDLACGAGGPGLWVAKQSGARLTGRDLSPVAVERATERAVALGLDAEVARVLRNGGRFAFVAFELDAERIAGLPVWGDPVGDYRPLLEQTGFEVLSYQQIPNWRDQVTEGFGAVVAEQGELEAELGQSAAAATVLEASLTLELQPHRGHVLQ